jgi:hypothetical protein
MILMAGRALVTKHLNFELPLDELRTRTHPLARFVHEFTNTLDRPFKDRSETAYRFANPDYRHFCLLRACRIVSALNAMIALAESGFAQEIGILFRTVYEAYTQIEATMAQIRNDGAVSGEVSTFIRGYFNDNARLNTESSSAVRDKSKRPNLSQRIVNELVGAQLEPFSTISRDDPSWKSPAERLAHLNIVFSNYVHGRYPEAMDLYGGIPGRFHLTGMRGTPKDQENLEVVKTLITSVSHCFIGVVQTLDLRAMLKHDPMLTDWYGRLGNFDP